MEKGVEKVRATMGEAAKGYDQGVSRWTGMILVLVFTTLQGKLPKVEAADHSSWMKDLHEDLRDVPLNQLAIPGSHNSGAYWLDEKGPLASDQLQVVKDYVERLGDLARQIVKKYSITQNLDITQQLRAGIRVFDIRASILNHDIHVYHGFYGRKLSQVLKDMNDFLDVNQKEVILVSINRRLDFTDTNYTNLADMITTTFGDKVFPPDTGKGVEITLNDVWATKKQVLVFFDVTGNYSFWPLDSLHLPFFDVVTSNELIAHLDERFGTVISKKINVFQAILTPNEAFLQSNIRSSLVELAKLGNKAVADWLDDIYSDCFKPNVTRRNVTVLWTDFVGDTNNVPSKVIRLNKLKRDDGCVSGCLGQRLPWLLSVVVTMCSLILNN